MYAKGSILVLAGASLAAALPPPQPTLTTTPFPTGTGFPHGTGHLHGPDHPHPSGTGFPHPSDFRPSGFRPSGFRPSGFRPSGVPERSSATSMPLLHTGVLPREEHPLSLGEAKSDLGFTDTLTFTKPTGTGFPPLPVGTGPPRHSGTRVPLPSGFPLPSGSGFPHIHYGTGFPHHSGSGSVRPTGVPVPSGLRPEPFLPESSVPEESSS